MNLVKLLPYVFKVLRETVEAAEALQGSGGGAEKKQAVMDVIKVLAEGIVGEAAAVAVMNWASIMIDFLVAVFNVTGKFSKPSA